MEESRYIITIKGKAHAMEPDKGINATVYLARFYNKS